jgi:hypothetical protein
MSLAMRRMRLVYLSYIHSKDLNKALSIATEDPETSAATLKQCKADILKTQELLKQSVLRAPVVKVPVQWMDEEDDEVLELGANGVFEMKAKAGPDLPIKA